MDYLNYETLEIIFHLLFKSQLFRLYIPNLTNEDITGFNEFKEILTANKLDKLKKDLNRFKIDIEKNALDECITYHVKENGLEIELLNKNKLQDFLEKYIKNFKTGTLEPTGTYYSFNKHKSYMYELINSHYKSFGFNIKLNTVDICIKPSLRNINKIDNYGRVLEFILYLNEKELINITNLKLFMPKANDRAFAVKTFYSDIYITLPRTPDEIFTNISPSKNVPFSANDEKPTRIEKLKKLVKKKKNGNTNFLTLDDVQNCINPTSRAKKLEDKSKKLKKNMQNVVSKLNTEEKLLGDYDDEREGYPIL